jgi:hypothetical protein
LDRRPAGANPARNSVFRTSPEQFDLLAKSRNMKPLNSKFLPPHKVERVSHELCPYVQRAVIALTEKRVVFSRQNIDLADKRSDR